MKRLARSLAALVLAWPATFATAYVVAARLAPEPPGQAGDDEPGDDWMELADAVQDPPCTGEVSTCDCTNCIYTRALARYAAARQDEIDRLEALVSLPAYQRRYR